MINRGLFRTVFCTGLILAGLMSGLNVYAAAPDPAAVPAAQPAQAPAVSAAQPAQAPAVPAAQPAQAPAVPAVQPTQAPTAAAAQPAAVTPTPIPAAQAATTLSIEQIVALVGHPRLNTSPVVSLAPVMTNTQAAPVTVDLIIFAGQSNMSGNGGNAALAPVVPAGAGYEYRPAASPNALYPLVEPFGRNETGLISDQPQFQNGSMVSSFVNTYFKKTGVPVVAVPATRGGTDSSFWASSTTKAELLSRFVKAKTYLEKNNFKVRRKFLVFMQGESDAVRGVTAFDYKNNLTSAFQPLFADGLEQVFIITPGYAVNGMYSYDDVVNAQTDLCNSNNMFTLASNILHSASMNGYLDDAVHYNQQALNLAGSSAATRAAAFAGGAK